MSDDNSHLVHFQVRLDQVQLGWAGDPDHTNDLTLTLMVDGTIIQSDAVSVNSVDPTTKIAVLNWTTDLYRPADDLGDIKVRIFSKDPWFQSNNDISYVDDRVFELRHVIGKETFDQPFHLQPYFDGRLYWSVERF